MAGARVGAQAQDAVLRLQLHLDGRVDEAGGQHGHADAQVGVHAVLELLGGAAHDALALAGRLARAKGLGGGRVGAVSISWSLS